MIEIEKPEENFFVGENPELFCEYINKQVIIISQNLSDEIDRVILEILKKKI